MRVREAFWQTESQGHPCGVLSNSHALDPRLAARNEEQDLDLHGYRHSQAQNYISFSPEIDLDVLERARLTLTVLWEVTQQTLTNYVSSICSIQSHSSSQSLLLNHIRIFLFSPHLLTSHQIRVPPSLVSLRWELTQQERGRRHSQQTWAAQTVCGSHRFSEQVCAHMTLDFPYMEAFILFHFFSSVQYHLPARVTCPASFMWNVYLVSMHVSELGCGGLHWESPNHWLTEAGLAVLQVAVGRGQEARHMLGLRHWGHWALRFFLSPHSPLPSGSRQFYFMYRD